jgi:hypothetical protein
MDTKDNIVVTYFKHLVSNIVNNLIFIKYVDTYKDLYYYIFFVTYSLEENFSYTYLLATCGKC